MSKKHTSIKKFKVYYFTGDYWSGKDEKRHYRTIFARSESEAEHIFKREYSNKNFGWIDEVKNSK